MSTPIPECAPSRTSLYTGLAPAHHGVTRNTPPFVSARTRSIAHDLLDAGITPGLAGKLHVGPPAAYPFETMEEYQAASFLKRQRGDPFVLVISTREPHRPYPTPPRTDPDAVTVPPFLIDTPATRRELAGYADLIATTDEKLGLTRALIADLALDENTVLLFMSDHGPAMPFCKWTLYEAGVTVPCLAAGPGIDASEDPREALVDMADLAPTLLALAGAPPRAARPEDPGAEPDAFDGTSALGVLDGSASTHREALFGRYDSARGSARSIRTAHHKLIANWTPRPPFTSPVSLGKRDDAMFASWVERAADDRAIAARIKRYGFRPDLELYELGSDPYELDDRAQAPEAAPVRDALRARLRDELVRLGDAFVEHLPA